MKFLTAITALLSYQLAGEILVRYFALAVPGPVIGMLLLFLTLLVRGRTAATIDTAARPILSHLPLLFVPAGVGVIVHLQRVGEEWLPIAAALLLSTLFTLAVTALVMSAALGLLARLTLR